MTATTHPTREQVQQYMAKRREDKTPPPTMDRIREMLGWHLIPDNAAITEHE